MGWNSIDYTVSADVELYLCGTSLFAGCRWYYFDAYDWTHELEWYYDGNKAYSPSSTESGDGNSYVLARWDYEGNEEKDTDSHPDDEYVWSYRKGHFTQEVFVDGFFTKNKYPEIKLSGDKNGYGSVLEASAE